MNKLQITDLIAFIKADPILQSIFASRVFFISSVDTQTETSLYLNVLSENRKQDTNESLVDFRIMLYGEEKGPLEVADIIDKVKSVFEKNDIIIGSGKYYQVDIMNDMFIQENALKNYEGVTTMIFKNSK